MHEEQAQPRRTATELYDKLALFRKARQFAIENHDDWYILSAKHGLLNPDGPPIDPYDDTLSAASADRKRDWAQHVATQLQ